MPSFSLAQFWLCRRLEGISDPSASVSDFQKQIPCKSWGLCDRRSPHPAGAALGTEHRPPPEAVATSFAVGVYQGLPASTCLRALPGQAWWSRAASLRSQHSAPRLQHGPQVGLLRTAVSKPTQVLLLSWYSQTPKSLFTATENPVCQPAPLQVPPPSPVHLLSTHLAAAAQPHSCPTAPTPTHRSCPLPSSHFFWQISLCKVILCPSIPPTSQEVFFTSLQAFKHISQFSFSCFI